MATAALSHEHAQEEMQKEVARKFEQLKDAVTLIAAAEYGKRAGLWAGLCATFVYMHILSL